MNYSKVVLFILVGILFISCHGKYTENKTLLHAEALLTEKPDSAQKVLLSVPHPEKLSRVDYAAWCLLYTNSQYKLYQYIKSDSIIRVAIKYYDKSNLYKQSGTAYYLFGCILQLKQNNKVAMQAYKRAEDLLSTTNENDLKGLVDFKIGYLYQQDEILVQSITNYKKSLNSFIRSNNKKYQAFAYRAISDMYAQLYYPFDSIMHYSNEALKLANQAGDTDNYSSILAQQGELLYSTDYVRSKESLLKGYRFFPTHQSSYAPFLSFTYSKLNRPDSARYYLNVALADTTNVNDRTVRFLAGAYVSKDEGNLNQAFHFLEKAYQNRDIIFQHSIRSQLYQIDKQYDLTQKEKENAQLKISNQHNEILISLLVIGVLVLSFLIFYVVNLQNKRLLKIGLVNQMKQQQLEYDLKLKQAENKQKQELLLVKLQSRIRNTLSFNRLNIGCIQADKKEEFMQMIIEESVLSEKEWQHYIDDIDQIFEKKITLFKSTYSDLSQLDLIVITLICLQIDISDSCSLLDMTKLTMYKRRFRIKERIGLEREIDLEEWVMEYIQSTPAEEEPAI